MYYLIVISTLLLAGTSYGDLVTAGAMPEATARDLAKEPPPPGAVRLVMTRQQLEGTLVLLRCHPLSAAPGGGTTITHYGCDGLEQ